MIVVVVVIVDVVADRPNHKRVDTYERVMDDVRGIYEVERQGGHLAIDPLVVSRVVLGV